MNGRYLYSVGHHFFAQVTAETQQGPFTDAVGAPVGISLQGCHRADIENMSGTVRDHGRQKPSGQMIGRKEVDVEHTRQRPLRFIMHGSRLEEPCVVHEHINGITGLQDMICKGFYPLAFREVGIECGDPASVTFGKCALPCHRFMHTTGREDEMTTRKFSGKAFGNSPADALTCSCDDDVHDP